jgi:hypothetical protein
VTLIDRPYAEPAFIRPDRNADVFAFQVSRDCGTFAIEDLNLVNPL